MNQDIDALVAPPSGKNLRTFAQPLVTREEYEGLFGAIVRLTDRIEALEFKYLKIEGAMIALDGAFKRMREKAE